jgi:hypothetical protein
MDAFANPGDAHQHEQLQVEEKLEAEIIYLSY